MVVDFVVGRVLSHDGQEAVSGLDDVTTYYLLHRHDFGLGDAARRRLHPLRVIVQSLRLGTGEPA